MEVWIDLLVVILIVVHTKLVMELGLVLPLLVWLDVEQLHKLFDLHLGVLASKGLAGSEESVVTLDRVHEWLGWPFVFFLFIIVAVVTFTVTVAFSFFAFFAVVVAILVFFLLAVEVLVLWLRHGVVVDDHSFHSLVGTISRRFFQLLNGCEGISLWPWFLLEWAEPRLSVDGECTWEFLVADICLLVVSHVKWCEHGVCEPVELPIGLELQLASLFLPVLDVGELDGVALDANLTDKVFHLTISGLTQVVEDSVLQLGVLLEISICANLFFDFGSENVLVSEEVDYLALVERHTLLVSVLECGLIESVPVLHVIVGLLRLFGKLGLEGLVHHAVIDSLEVFLADSGLSGGVIHKLVQECPLFLLGEAGEHWHETLEGFLLFLELLVLRLGGEVENLNEIFEFLGVSVDLLEESFTEVVLIVEFSDFVFLVISDCDVRVPIGASDLLEEIVLILALLWLWELDALGQGEWEEE